MNEHSQQQQGQRRSEPLYHVDSGPPTLLRIYADDQDKRSLCIFWGVFFFVIVLIGLVSIASFFLFYAVPRAILSKSNEQQLKGTNLQGCKNPNTLDDHAFVTCGQQNYDSIGVIMKDLQQYNQFGLVMLHFMIKDEDKEIDIKKKVQVDLIELREIDQNNTVAFQFRKKYQGNHTLQIHSDEAIPVYDKEDSHIIAYSLPIYVIRKFNSSSYLYLVKFQNGTVQNFENVKKQIESEVFVVNPEFTKYSIAIRYVYFFLSLMSTVFYLIHYFSIPSRYRIIEQSLIGFLSVMLVLFNDPFYQISVLNPNPVSAFFSVFFMVDFVLTLFFVWIIFLDRIHYEDGQKNTKLSLWKRAIYIVITYLLVFSLYLLYALDNLENTPIIPAHDLYGTSSFQGLEITVLLVIIGGFIYLFVRYLQICSSAENKMWRSQLFLYFSILFLFITAIMFFVEGFRVNDYQGNRILVLYSQMNFYVFYLQAMYRVTKDEMERVKKGHMDPHKGQSVIVDRQEVNLSFEESQQKFRGFKLQEKEEKYAELDEKSQEPKDKGFDDFSLE